MLSKDIFHEAAKQLGIAIETKTTGRSWSIELTFPGLPTCQYREFRPFKEPSSGDIPQAMYHSLLDGTFFKDKRLYAPLSLDWLQDRIAEDELKDAVLNLIRAKSGTLRNNPVK